MSQATTAQVQVMAIVGQSMVCAIGGGMAVGSCNSNGRSSTIRSRGAAIWQLVVFNCRGPIAILPRRDHVLRYVHTPVNCRAILQCFPRFIGGRCYGGIINRNVLLFHLCETKARMAERADEGKLAGLLLMVGKPFLPKPSGGRV